MSQSDVDAIVVESSYEGPMLGMRRADSSSSSEAGLGLELEGAYVRSNLVTVEFVHELITCFKNQKLLHRKYALLILMRPVLISLRSFPPPNPT